MRRLKTVLLVLAHLLWVALLTVLTQVGGVIHLLCIPAYGFFRVRYSQRLLRYLGQTLCFLLAYLVIVLFVLPLLAGGYGRVHLPITNTDLRPQNFMTVVLCRNYVRPSLRNVAMEVALEMKRKHGATLLYLDAQHPFGDKWPLLPHLSHSDGLKLDLALLWKRRSDNKPVAETPSVIGYGVFVEPRPQDTDVARSCAAKGYWQYSVMDQIIPQTNKPHYVLDEERTAAMVRLFCQHKKVKRVLIEPHLKERLDLNSLTNLRHAGCHAVRHDDHIHVEGRD
jgi:hypothetical protein